MNDFITGTLWDWFLGWPFYAHIALAAGAVLFAWGALNGLITLASKIGGWQGGLGALLAVGGLIAALWPRKAAPDRHEHVAGKDAAPPVPKPRKKRPIFRLGK